MCERNADLLLLTHPQPGTWPVTQAYALTRNRTDDLQVCEILLNTLSHTGEGMKFSLNQSAHECACLHYEDWKQARITTYSELFSSMAPRSGRLQHALR